MRRIFQENGDIKLTPETEVQNNEATISAFLL
jgi:hypothetical protein